MALATSKRKFYRLLDNLSSSKVSSHTAAPATAPADPARSTTDRPAKRARMPTSTTAPAAAAAVSSRSSLASTVRLLSPGLKSPLVPQRLSASLSLDESTTYAPWSQEQFLQRMATFADVKVWSSKPERLGDVEWARRGWVAAGEDEVACNTCGKRMLVRIETGGVGADGVGEEEEQLDGPAWWQQGIEEDFVNKYEQLIVEGHATDCLWRKAGCKDDIYRIKFSDPGQWQADLSARYNSLIEASSSLPARVVDPLDGQVGTELPSIVDLSEYFAVNTQAPSAELSAGQEPSSTLSLNKRKAATIMAIGGWTARDVSGVPIVWCSKCFTRVGLWLYSPSATDAAVADADVDIMKFDATSLHRTHCPWQNPESQSGLGSYAGLPAWRILVELMGLESSKAARRRSTRPVAITINGTDDSQQQNDYDEDADDDEDADTAAGTSQASRDEIERQDKERETRLEKLKRAFAVKNTIKKTPRPISARSAKSLLSARSLRLQKED